MNVQFAPERWLSIKQTYRQWWAGELDRPVIAVWLGGYDSGRPEPELPAHGFHSFYDRSVSPQAIIDRVDYDLGGQRFFGDAFPTFWPNFGPGIGRAPRPDRLDDGRVTVLGGG